MGFAIALQDERGERLEVTTDPKNHLHRLLRPYQGSDSVLGEIDWYGDTVFNRIQIRRFLLAWKELLQHAQSQEEAKIVEGVRFLAERCEADVHLYLKFIGD